MGLALLPVCLFCAEPVAAQVRPAESLPAGTLVRVHPAGESPLRGRVETIDDRCLTLLLSGGRVPVPLTTLEGIDRAAGRDRARGAIRGASIGGAIGGVVVAVLAYGAGPESERFPRERSVASTLAAALVGAAVGAAGGAAVGAVAAPTRWEPLPAPLWRGEVAGMTAPSCPAPSAP